MHIDSSVQLFHKGRYGCPYDGCTKRFNTIGDKKRHLRIHASTGKAEPVEVVVR